MRKLLVHIKQEYGNPEIVVTENGASDLTGDLNDDFRIRYHSTYIDSMRKGSSSYRTLQAFIFEVAPPSPRK